jgi:hypothetical protein
MTPKFLHTSYRSRPSSTSKLIFSLIMLKHPQWSPFKIHWTIYSFMQYVVQSTLIVKETQVNVKGLLIQSSWTNLGGEINMFLSDGCIDLLIIDKLWRYSLQFLWLLWNTRWVVVVHKYFPLKRITTWSN